MGDPFTVVTSHSYTYDNLNRRTRAVLEDGSEWDYGYNDRNELTSAQRRWPDTTFVAGQQFGYAYDNIGNRTSVNWGGDASGANLRSASYTANSLNEYTAISADPYKDIVGVALATNSVTVNGSTASRHGEYFRQEIATTNSSSSEWQQVAVTSGTFSTAGGMVLPRSSQTLIYDADGNLSFDGAWNYHWDGENRLISMDMTNVAGIANSNRLRLDFAYDCMDRRIQKIISVWNGSTFVTPATNLFVYDGQNLLAIINPQLSVLESFTWGQDLSGTMTKAGGSGGLLMASISQTNCFAVDDGSGNITALINASDKTVGARYEYGAFGELVRSTGCFAPQNPFRFSTKFCDQETGVVYYGSRFYSPALGRWLSRDPSGEKGSLNLLLAFVNNPCANLDPNGQGIFQKMGSWAALIAAMGHIAHGGQTGNIEKIMQEMQKNRQKIEQIEEDRKKNKRKNSGSAGGNDDDDDEGGGSARALTGVIAGLGLISIEAKLIAVDGAISTALGMEAYNAEVGVCC